MSAWQFISAAIALRYLLDAHKLKTIFQVRGYTLLSYPRLSKLYDLARHLDASAIHGDLVECGVWHGGSAGVLGRAGINEKRRMWLFDSWEGLPEPGEFDINFRGTVGKKGHLSSSEQRARELLFGKLELSEERVHVIRGWFEQVIPERKKEIDKIALLHLDCDWYASVKTCLNELFDLVSPGGYVVIDDYGHWQGCKRAVDEFLAERGVTTQLERIDYTAVYFRR